MTYGPTKKIRTRMKIVALILVGTTVLTSLVQLFRIMIVKGEFYKNKAASQQLYDTEMTAQRGDIYDRNGNLLATSSTVWTVYVTPNGFKSITDKTKLEATKNEIADNLSQILECEREKVVEKLNTQSSYVIVKKKVESDKADQIRDYISKSKNNVANYIGLDKSTKRTYPNGSLASVVLGFVGDDNQGLSGLEAQYDNELTGTAGRMIAAKKANGDAMPFSYEKIIDAEPGSTLKLSLDTYIQYVCENHLEQAVKDNQAEERGACIVMNVKTGEILGMAVKGDFDPNEPFELSDEDNAKLDAITDETEKKNTKNELLSRQWRNKAISDAYEPGSVFKIFTAAAALEEKITSTSHTYNCTGKITVSGQSYNCHKHSGHGSQTLGIAMNNSCNPAFITIGEDLGVEKFSDYFSAFGFTEKTGIDLPGEATPVYHSKEKMGPVELASSAFGQTFQISPLQLITAVSAAVNGGKLVTPHIVNEIIDSEGNTVKSIGTNVKRQVISEETSAIIRQMLEDVVVNGGGKNAYVSGYRIGGKTGTSQKVAEIEATGSHNLYIGSFVGIAPIDDPEIAVLVMIDQPNVENGAAYYGSAIAAPAGGQIISEVLPYLGFEPQYSEEEIAKMAVTVPNIVGKDVVSAKSAVTSAGLSYKVVGSGETVTRQFPSAAKSVYKNGVVVIYTDDTSSAGTVAVPNFSGMSVSAANTAAANSGLNIKFFGADIVDSGVTAYKQDISPGSTVEYGTVVSVYFRRTDAAD